MCPLMSGLLSGWTGASCALRVRSWALPGDPLGGNGAGAFWAEVDDGAGALALRLWLALRGCSHLVCPLFGLGGKVRFP